jgi:hypothetical protein
MHLKPSLKPVINESPERLSVMVGSSFVPRSVLSRPNAVLDHPKLIVKGPAGRESHDRFSSLSAKDHV